MENIVQIIEQIIKYVWLIVILFGFGFSLANVCKLLVKHHNKKRQPMIQKVRSELGWYVLLWLDFIIAADIVSTLVERSIVDLLELVVVVWVRIAVSYFLEREIHALSKEIV